MVGARAPKNAPAFKRATMLEETSAALAAFVENLKSIEKLDWSAGRAILWMASTWTYLLSATTEPATPVSKPNMSDAVLATTATATAGLCFDNRLNVDDIVARYECCQTPRNCEADVGCRAKQRVDIDFVVLPCDMSHHMTRETANNRC